MDLKKYDELRKKINTKDFEGKYHQLDKWLFMFSFIGNIGSIFFAYFLLYPSLFKAISINLVDGLWATAISFTFTITFLGIFEIVKRYIVRNFSHDFVYNSYKLKVSIFGWFLISMSIIALSFYLSIIGSKNLATTSLFKNSTMLIEVRHNEDSIIRSYENKKTVFLKDNESLRSVNNNLREKLANTLTAYRTIRNDYQLSIDKNVDQINKNLLEINKIDTELNLALNKLDKTYSETKNDNEEEDFDNIFLFVIIVTFTELIIIGGLYFREYYEYNLYLQNHQKYEKFYNKRDRYRALLSFIYGDGKVAVGDKVMSGLMIKDIVADKTSITNSNKFVDEFLHDMDRLGIFSTVGKRRLIQLTYQDALNLIENLDDAYRVLENLK